MFRKGGLSQETGIMSGLDSPRRSYAGGGNIGGGSILGNPMGSRTGFRFPGTISGYDVPYNKITRAIPTNWKTKSMNLLKNPKFSEKGLWELGKRYAPKAWNLAKKGLTRFPLLTTAIGGEYVTRPEEWEKEMGISRWDKLKRDLTPYFGTKKKIEQYKK